MHSLKYMYCQCFLKSGFCPPLGQVHISSPASPARAYQRPRGNCSRNGPTSGTKLYFHNARRARELLVAVEEPAEADPVGPGLAEDLVDVAARPDADLVLVRRVFDLR